MPLGVGVVDVTAQAAQYYSNITDHRHEATYHLADECHGKRHPKRCILRVLGMSVPTPAGAGACGGSAVCRRPTRLSHVVCRKSLCISRPLLMHLRSPQTQERLVSPTDLDEKQRAKQQKGANPPKTGFCFVVRLVGHFTQVLRPVWCGLSQQSAARPAPLLSVFSRKLR